MRPISEKPTLLNLMQRPEAREAQKALDFLDGKFYPHIVAFLNDPYHGRKDWRDRGMVPRWRNLTKSIVEKSGMLFSQNTPRLTVYKEGEKQPDLELSATLLKLFDEFDWVSFFQNFDQVLRLMKTACVLMQWDPEEEELVPSILTQANCYCECDPFTGELMSCVVKLSGNASSPMFDPKTGYVKLEEEECYFRVFTEEEIIDYTVTTKGDQIETARIPNPFGIIPIACFHDILQPRGDCFWNQPGTDLVNLNEAWNIAMIDTEYAMTYSKMQTLVTNAKIISDKQDTPVITELYGQPTPRYSASQKGVVVGPGSVMTIETNGETPFVQYMGPNPDLPALDNVLNGWICDIAGDWSVNIKTGNGKTGTSGNAAKTSGFQLIVEELDNVQLRQRRQKSMAEGFNELFDVVQTIMNVVAPGTFPVTSPEEDLDVSIEFSYPHLPVDEKSEAEAWVIKVQNNQASLIDYQMTVNGLCREEAVEKVKEILAVNGGNLDYDADAPENAVDPVLEAQEEQIELLTAEAGERVKPVGTLATQITEGQEQ